MLGAAAAVELASSITCSIGFADHEPNLKLAA